MEYCESQDSRRYEVSQSRSPGSPDRQYCSSTTQPLGDSMLGHVEVGILSFLLVCLWGWVNFFSEPVMFLVFAKKKKKEKKNRKEKSMK